MTIDEAEPRCRSGPVTSPSLVVLAASAGGLQAVGEVLASLPADFPAAIAVVQHRAARVPDLLPGLLARRTALKVRAAREGDPLEAGTVYVCPPGVHMRVEPRVHLVEGERIEFVRPSADELLRSVARTYGDQAIAVVLSGAGSDGASGSHAVSRAGGSVIAQDPATSAHRGMPTAAIAKGNVELILPLDRIGAELQRLVVEGAAREGSPACDGAPARSAGAKVAPIRVLLADHRKIILDGLDLLLRGERDLEVVGIAGDGASAVRLAAELSPDVAVMDVAMPDLDGVDATRRIRSRDPRTRVVALSARSDPETMRRIFDAGARGFLGKSAAFSELAATIRSVAADADYISPLFVEVLDGDRRRPAEAGGSAFTRLTTRERDLVQRLAQGEAIDAIARRLGMNVRTIEISRRQLMEKLGVVDLDDLKRCAIREGLVAAGS